MLEEAGIYRKQNGGRQADGVSTLGPVPRYSDTRTKETGILGGPGRGLNVSFPGSIYSGRTVR